MNNSLDVIAFSYTGLIHKARKKTAPYGVIFPDFPGCLVAGKTIDEALENARKGLIFHIESMQEAEEPIPQPTPLEKILENYRKEDFVIYFAAYLSFSYKISHVSTAIL